jgi:hypothetical protein
MAKLQNQRIKSLWDNTTDLLTSYSRQTAMARHQNLRADTISPSEKTALAAQLLLMPQVNRPSST